MFIIALFEEKIKGGENDLLFSSFIQPVCFSSKTIIYLDETSKYNNNRPLKLTFQRAVQI